MKKKFWPTFPRNKECGKPHGKIDNYPKGILTKPGSYNIISVTPNCLLKTQNFEKKGNLSNKENLWLILSILSSATNFREEFRRVYKDFQHFLFRWQDHSFGTQEVYRNKYFGKNWKL